jgi:hypothetical protein
VRDAAKTMMIGVVVMVTLPLWMPFFLVYVFGQFARAIFERRRW